MSFQSIVEEKQKNGEVDTQINLWQLILNVADEMYPDSEVYWVLDGFAIEGAKIKVGDKGFKMVRGKRWTKKEWKNDRSEFLLPFKNEIKYIFKTAYQRFI